MATLIRLNGAGASGAAGSGGTPSALQVSFAGGVARENVAYFGALVASGGVLPYTFSISAGALPTGMSINSATGLISGTPTVLGSFSFTGQVTDFASTTATVAASILVIATLPGNATAGSLAEIGPRTLDKKANFPDTVVAFTVTYPATVDHLNFWYWSQHYVNGAQAPTGNSTTLSGNINNSVTNIPLTSSTDATGGRYLYIDTEYMYIPVGGGPSSVIRGALGTTAASHSNGANVVVISLAFIETRPVTLGSTSGAYNFSISDIFGQAFGMVVSTGNDAGDNWWPLNAFASNEITLTLNTPGPSIVQNASVTAFSAHADYFAALIDATVGSDQTYWGES